MAYYEPHRDELEAAFSAPVPIRFVEDCDEAYLEEVIAASEFPGGDERCDVFAPGLGTFRLPGAHHPRGTELCRSATVGQVLTDRIRAQSKGGAAPHLTWVRDAGEQLTQPEVLSALKRWAQGVLRTGSGHRILLTGSNLHLPAEVTRYAAPLDLTRPRNPFFGAFIDAAIAEHLTADFAGHTQDVARVLRGLDAPSVLRVIREAGHVARVKGTNDGVFLSALRDERDRLLRRSAVIEVVAVEQSSGDVGGLKNLVRWITERSYLFQRLEEAKADRIEPVRGVLLVGMPGCGKSLMAKVAGAEFGVPLLRMDVGRLLGKYLGESEANLAAALATAEAAAPCILWIDELEKALAGSSNDNSSGGTTTRMLGQLLTWMQESRSGVFLLATANAVGQLPPELTRRGRFDEFFFVDLPTTSERREIIDVKLTKMGWTLGTSDVEQLATMTENYSGADIETLLKMAIEDTWLFSGNAPDRSLDARALERVRATIVPIGKQWEAELKGIRADLDARGFRAASARVSDPASPHRTPRVSAQMPADLLPLLQAGRAWHFEFELDGRTLRLASGSRTHDRSVTLCGSVAPNSARPTETRYRMRAYRETVVLIRVEVADGPAEWKAMPERMELRVASNGIYFKSGAVEVGLGLIQFAPVAHISEVLTSPFEMPLAWRTLDGEPAERVLCFDLEGQWARVWWSVVNPSGLFECESGVHSGRVVKDLGHGTFFPNEPTKTWRHASQKSDYPPHLEWRTVFERKSRGRSADEFVRTMEAWNRRVGTFVMFDNPSNGFHL